MLFLKNHREVVLGQSTSGMDLVEFIVGGVRYSIFKQDVEKHPDSFLAVAMKKEWHNGNGAIAVERDGELFRYVYAFLATGQAPKNVKRRKLVELYEEAEFYGLAALQQECVAADFVGHINIHKAVQRFVEDGWGSHITVDYPLKKRTSLIKALDAVWSPFCYHFKIREKFLRRHELNLPIYKSTTARNVNVPELLADAAPFSFEHGCTFGSITTSCLEIPASKLDQDILEDLLQCFDLKAFCPHLEAELHLYKLVIHQEGGHFDQHRDTVRGEGHIGTLELILNSTYFGGELEISHGGKTEVVTGPYHWVAMYGDCLHKLHPVTSGTRVSLIYDVYLPSSANSDDMWGAFVGENHFWTVDRAVALPDDVPVRGLTTAQVADIRAALDEQLAAALDKQLAKGKAKGGSSSAVIVALQHLYPACQAVPGFLKGGDAVLYDLLTKDHPDHPTRYEVEVVHCCISRSYHHEDDDYSSVSAGLFSPFRKPVVRRPHHVSNKPSEPTKPELTLLVVPHPFHSHVLDHSPYIDHVGNESQAEQTVYVVAGLQVRRKQ